MSLSPYWYDRHRSWLESRFFKPEEWDFPLSDWQPWRNWPSFPSFPSLRDDSSTITQDKDKFQINVDVQHFSPEEITVKTSDGSVVIEGKHEEKRDDHGYVSRQFQRRYTLPETCIADTVQCSLSSDGVLTVTAPLKLALPGQNERIIPITQTGPVPRKIHFEEKK